VDPPYIESIANHFPVKVMKDITHKEKKPVKFTSPTKHKKTMSATIQSPQKNLSRNVNYSKDTENFAQYQSSIISQYVDVENKYYESEDRIPVQKPLAFNIVNYESSVTDERKNMESIGASPSFNSRNRKFDSQKDQYKTKSVSNYESQNEVDEMYYYFIGLKG